MLRSRLAAVSLFGLMLSAGGAGALAVTAGPAAAAPAVAAAPVARADSGCTGQSAATHASTGVASTL